MCGNVFVSLSVVLWSDADFFSFALTSSWSCYGFLSAGTSVCWFVFVSMIFFGSSVSDFGFVFSCVSEGSEGLSC